MPEISVQRVGYAMGAAVRGVDLSRPLSASELRVITDAWHEHQVLVFPEQNLKPEDLIRFSSQFGELDDLESQPFNRLPGYDEIMLLTNRQVDGKFLPGASGGANWHTDLSYTIRPAAGTFLYCMEKPAVGGDTLFANMYSAYETLSPTLREFLDRLEAVNDVSLIPARRAPEIIAEFNRLNPPVIHPAVRTHPATGRRALYVNDRVRSFVGMTEAESAPIIRFLCKHAVTPKFTYRHRWSVRDLVMWDNRCSTHLAVGDYDPADSTQIRYMIRTSTRGEHRGRFVNPAQASHAVPVKPGEAMAAALSSMHD